MLNNKELRKEIAWMTWHSKEGHIPSAYSILDLVSFLYDGFLNIDYKNLKDVFPRKCNAKMLIEICYTSFKTSNLAITISD